MMAASGALSQQLGKVTEYGIYSKEHRLEKTTREIPIRADLRFGFCFEVRVDTREDSAMLVETLSHPPVPGSSGVEDAGYNLPRLFKVDRGVARGCAGYRSTSEADLRPGIWKFTISDRGNDVVMQEFTVK
ncbi:MAG: DUF3859 domain-containing protein [Burkholderiales bacterium]